MDIVLKLSTTRRGLCKSLPFPPILSLGWDENHFLGLEKALRTLQRKQLLRCSSPGSPLSTCPRSWAGCTRCSPVVHSQVSFLDLVDGGVEEDNHQTHHCSHQNPGLSHIHACSSWMKEERTPRPVSDKPTPSFPPSTSGQLAPSRRPSRESCASFPSFFPPRRTRSLLANLSAGGGPQAAPAQ